jgi:hypothetical protein
VKYSESIRRLGGLAGELAAVVRRRRENRKPRVRVRIAHGEARVLPEEAAARERLLSLASRLVAEYGRPGRGRA